MFRKMLLTLVTALVVGGGLSATSGSATAQPYAGVYGPNVGVRAGYYRRPYTSAYYGASYRRPYNNAYYGGSYRRPYGPYGAPYYRANRPYYRGWR